MSAARTLYKTETGSEEQLSESQLFDWLAQTEREGWGYSEILDELMPDPAIRRDFLANQFEGIEPGPTHELVANLVDGGFVKVIVTTNFDRLLERALQGRGIEPTVIATDDDLRSGVPREHASCVVLKPHGDYLRQTIRNTPDELASLEPRVEAELREIFDRYGVVVLGYSGSDEAIARIARERSSRYGLWWVGREPLGQPAGEIVEATGGRHIMRESASEFLTELESKLALFEVHPSGNTPAAVHDEVLGLLRAEDRIGLDELTRRESAWWVQEIRKLDELAKAGNPSDVEHSRAVWNAARPIFERQLAAWLPLAMYDAQRFAAALGAAAASLERRRTDGGFTAWTELPQYLTTVTGYYVGSVLVRLGKLDRLIPLLEQEWSDEWGHRSLLVSLPGETQYIIGEAMKEEGKQWIASGWEHLCRVLPIDSWLTERYPELLGSDEPRYSLSQFDFLVCVASAAGDREVVPFYSLARHAAEDLALRLHRDSGLRMTLAEGLGLNLETFDQVVPDRIREAQGFSGAFGEHRLAAKLLESG